MKVAAFTGEINDPSSRYRVRQYIDILKEYDIDIDDFISLNGKYPPVEKNKRLLWGAKTLAERFKQVVNVKLKNYDCIILQREMISTLNTFEKLTPRPRILDVDDAVYLYRRGNFIKKIAKSSDVVICGNEHLADVFEKWNNNIYIIPTAVDTRKYVPNVTAKRKKEKVTIGWIGTSGGFEYLYKIEKALNYILNMNKNSELLIVSDSEPKFSLIDNFRYIKWNEKSEVDNFQKIDIGLMPLIDDDWSRAKCSYKMLLHMSCETPVVVSPVGMNQEVLQRGNIGFGAVDYYSDWIESLEYLIDNEVKRSEMGKCARQVIENNYSLEILSKKMSEIIIKTVR
ncbi:glycosyltransferase family 4 protein [Clostridium algidicarnis]|uniref:glycosyltransferase family 4 protein n=1 Tax=Clostridium algidicarnis TaxID=37659 RepID=UPI0016296415|nr:glycosyltransferase family 4 protein [Clostridium algidicarnis]MBB6631975.1 glycosyltransferase family 4 protein [Clostridium algidicarnis]